MQLSSWMDSDIIQKPEKSKGYHSVCCIYGEAPFSVVCFMALSCGHCRISNWQWNPKQSNTTIGWLSATEEPLGGAKGAETLLPRERAWKVCSYIHMEHSERSGSQLWNVVPLLWFPPSRIRTELLLDFQEFITIQTILPNSLRNLQGVDMEVSKTSGRIFL